MATPKTPRPPTVHTVLGQPSWKLGARGVTAYVTELGGHLGPVSFRLGKKPVEPFSVAPWAQEPLDPSMPAIIRVLRGDFFCLPFGGNATPHREERHPVHGETANARWKLESLTRTGGRSTLHLSLKTKIRKGRVDKRISLFDGQTAVYCEHVISGMGGPMNLGHHAMLRFPEEPGSGIISTSPFVRGQVFPGAFEDAAQGGYSWLKPGAEFASLDRVPTITGELADLTRYPARQGFEDLVLVAADPTLPLAWTAVAFPKERYVWFALKDPRVLTGTIFWISNGGRHYPPWSGRHVGVLGLEEVTAYFHYGLDESARPNPFSRSGHPTSFRLDSKVPLAVRYVMGVAAIPAGFGPVSTIEPYRGREAGPRAQNGAETGIEILGRNRKRVRVPLDIDFLRGP